MATKKFKSRTALKPTEATSDIASMKGISDFYTQMGKEDQDKILQTIQKKTNTKKPDEKKNIDETPVKKESEIFDSAIEKESYLEVLPLSFLQEAPLKWNFYKKFVNTRNYVKLLDSILEYGLMQPITVWEQGNNEYMILSGHTRAAIYKQIYTVSNEEKWATIPCRIYKKNDLDDIDAQKIIILANIAQRGTQDPITMCKSIVTLEKLEKKKPTKKNNIIQTLLDKDLLGISRRSYFNYKSLNSLIDDFLEAISNNEISLVSGLILKDFPEDTQRMIYEQVPFNLLTSPTINKVKNIKDPEKMIEKIISLKSRPKKFSFSPKESVPKTMDIIPIFVSKKDTEVIKNVLVNMINTSKELDTRTKKTIMKYL